MFHRYHLFVFCEVFSSDCLRRLVKSLDFCSDSFLVTELFLIWLVTKLDCNPLSRHEIIQTKIDLPICFLSNSCLFVSVNVYLYVKCSCEALLSWDEGLVVRSLLIVTELLWRDYWVNVVSVYDETTVLRQVSGEFKVFRLQQEVDE